ncbi:sorting nexin-8-like [Onthophagus taurus]|uniref:sorting nexin-8-like n=1 Tax=Onthophagus taurus TaxID=166361 RepID=UPI000C203736|nr:sorting nexin-8-like [Onthophagus taurus]XP_022905143.1 sorting nexin-8-like [Onthophagus taurus]
MTTDFSAGSIPSVYRELYDTCSHDGEIIHKDVYKKLLAQSKLDVEVLKTIYDLIVTENDVITRTGFYKTLALISWGQQGKNPSNKLFETFDGTVYPIPNLGDLSSLKSLKIYYNLQKNPSKLNLTYLDITQLETINIELVPEKKGIFLKHSEYIVSSQKRGVKVTRRYNDFVALYELLLSRFPYRIIPRLPPKKIVSDSHFLESRRRGLNRWLTLICRHPTISNDGLLIFFLTDQGNDVQYRIRDIFRRAPDEFMTSDYAANSKELVPKDNTEFASNREQVKTLVNIISKIKNIADSNVERFHNYSKDNDVLSTQLKCLGAVNLGQSGSNWSQMQRGFTAISKDLTSLSSKAEQQANIEQMTVCERLDLLLDVLIGHKDLCERLEKGLANDHQTALAKMLSLKKRKIQGVIKGVDAESVEQLETKMLAQENVITNMELRSDFSLYCVHMETQLVHAYLETLSSILSSLINLRIRSHTELANIWKQVVENFLPKKNGS